MISVNGLTKQFKSPIQKEGRFKGLRTMLSRDYRIKEAVRDISFIIEPGEFVGYIGPNGAGKSTTIKMLAGILHPTAGEVRIGGLSPHRERRSVARRLGVLFGQRTQLWWDLPVRDSFDILAAMYGIPEDVKASRLRQLGELLELGPFLDTPVRKLSLGQRMRADIAAALLHDPDILFLDEPTIGLDLIAKRSIREFLGSINAELGKTILLTTHDMDDIEQLCSRVIVINHGRLGFDGTIDELRRRIGLPTVIRVTYRHEVKLPGSLANGGAGVNTGPGAGFGIPDGYRRAEASLIAAQSLSAASSPLKHAGEGQLTLAWSPSGEAELGSERPVTAGWPLSVTAFDGRLLTVECNREQLSAMEALRLLCEIGDIEDVHMEEPDFEDIVHRIY